MSPTWQAFRFWSRMAWSLFFGLFVWFFPAALISGAIGFWDKGWGDAFYLLSMSAIMVCLAYASFRVRDFPCPRCGLHFFSSTWWYSPFAKKCVHCGLRKWADPDEKSM
jgi:hypothetical protein